MFHHGAQRRVMIHQVISERKYGDSTFGLRGKVLTDHENGDTADNRRRNIRIVTPSFNSVNKPARGYWFHRKNRNWRARIRLDQKNYHLGCFPTTRQARAAYLAAKKAYLTKGELPS